jgi:hyperosmotically inducible periplasmic protein
MKLNMKTMYRSSITAIAATALAAGMSTAAIAGDDKANENANANSAHYQQDWQGEMKDAWIDGKIEASYSLSTYLNPFTIDTRVQKGEVTLSGTVESEIDKDLAEEIAMGIEGVTKVNNELEVAEEMDRENAAERMANNFGDRFNDATLTARVKFALLANDSTEGLSINVDTENGTVFLNGEVKSEQEAELAERIAANAEGVASVENRLTVSGQS